MRGRRKNQAASPTQRYDMIYTRRGVGQHRAAYLEPKRKKFNISDHQQTNDSEMLQMIWRDGIIISSLSQAAAAIAGPAGLRAFPQLSAAPSRSGRDVHVHRYTTQNKSNSLFRFLNRHVSFLFKTCCILSR